MNLHWKNKDFEFIKRSKRLEFHKLEKYLSSCKSETIRMMVINRMEDIVNSL